VARGHQVTIFSIDPAPSQASYKVTQPAPSARWTKSLVGSTFGFAVWVAAQDYSRFDLIHAMGDNHLLRASVPVLRTLSGSALDEAAHARRLRLKLLYLVIYGLELIGVTRASGAVGISAFTNRHFPGVTRSLPNGVDLSLFCPQGEKSPSPSILAVGHKLHDRKRLDVLLEVFQAQVRGVVPDAELWLVFNDRVDQPGVRCFSDLTHTSLADLYSKAWVFCLPSSYEGFGRPYLEAMASGTAVLATPNGGATELLAKSGAGELVELAKLGDALLALLTDTGRRQRLELKGLAAAQPYGWPSVVAMYEEVYDELLSARR
jgi:glycosyltransferase involved in cell wall biosynthesis